MARPKQARDRIEPYSEQSQALARSPVPTLITHCDVAHFDRILIVTHPDNLVRPGRQSLEVAAQLAPRFAHGRPIRTVSATSDPVQALFADKKEMDWIEARDPIDWIKRNLPKTDLPFFAGLEAVQRVPALLDGRAGLFGSLASDPDRTLGSTPAPSLDHRG